jgi:hypothetical protein
MVKFPAGALREAPFALIMGSSEAQFSRSTVKTSGLSETFHPTAVRRNRLRRFVADQ